MLRRTAWRISLALACLAAPALAEEPPMLAPQVEAGDLPPMAERLPETPLVSDFEAMGRTIGDYGGALRTVVAGRKDTRQMVVWGYARLVGYDHNYELKPDLLQDVAVEEGRRFILRLRPGHRWSDGAPFTSEDFRYWWEDVAQNAELSPSGPPVSLFVEGEPPQVSFPDEHTVIYEWSKPNPRFLPMLAQARPPFIYRPAEYMRQFHADYADAEFLEAAVAETQTRGWAPLHNKRDNLYKNDDANLPSLQPWARSPESSSSRLVFNRNPYFHRVDPEGNQLPYLDRVYMTVAAGGLIAAKTNAGESDLQSRGLGFSDVSVLKRGEEMGGYATRLWSNGTASQIALYPNLTVVDELWRPILRDVRFRRALSLAIDRRVINRSLYFGLAKENGVSVLPQSPFYDEAQATAWARYDIDQANALLDDMGLTDRAGDGTRLLPNGAPMEVIVRTAGERGEVEDALQLITETWREIGVKLIMRPLDRNILRDQVYAGRAMMAVWYGWNNGLPTADTAPDYLAPQFQEDFAWPRWGQYHQTKGEAGEAPDMPEALRLLDLSKAWSDATDAGVRAEIWREMLAIHADQVYGIGVVNQSPQPVVVSNRLRNVPESGVWAWDPGAHFGVHRMDTFYFEGGVGAAE